MDQIYVVGANKVEGFTYKDLNGLDWRFKYDANLNYPISNLEDLGKEMKMFSSTLSSPQLVIIGKDSKIIYNVFGYYPEEDIRAMIEAALKTFEDVNLTNKIENIFLENTKISIDLNDHFKSVTGQALTYEIVEPGIGSIIDPELNGSVLNISRGENTGITSITVKASNPDSVFSIDEFKVMTYPASAQILDFEEGDSSEIYFYYDGDAVWNTDSAISYHGDRSFRSGYILTPDYEGGVTYTLARTEFTTDKDDTLSFAYKISSQFESDGLEFAIDNAVFDFPDKKWSGEIDWTFAQYPVKAGTHVIDWDYFKWEYSAGGMDAAWIDLVRIPGIISGLIFENEIHDYSIIRNYPNPFNSSTVLTFNLKTASNPKLTIYNIKGETVTKVELGNMDRGSNKFNLNLDGLNSGTYYYRLETDSQNLNGKLLYLK